MKNLTVNQVDMVSGGVVKGPSGGSMIDAIVTGIIGFGYDALLGAVGVEGGAAAIVSGVAIYAAHELPALPPPTEGGAFYVHKQ